MRAGTGTGKGTSGMDKFSNVVDKNVYGAWKLAS